MALLFLLPTASLAERGPSFGSGYYRFVSSDDVWGKDQRWS